MKRLVCPSLVVLWAVSTMAAGVAQSKRTAPTAPEQFSVNANVKGEAGAAAASFVIAVQRYSSDKEREILATALQQGGYPSFLPVLRKAAIVGHVEAGSQKWNIRYARETVTEKGRTIVVVTDQPVYFAGGARADAKPREGYGVAVAQFDVDDIGLGKGTMAGAARVKPGGPAGVQIDDYADKPIELVTVRRLPG